MTRPQVFRLLFLLLILSSSLRGAVGPLQINEVQDRVLGENESLQLNLGSSGGAGAARFSLITGPQGMTVASDGGLRWTPSESQGPSTNPIVVQVSTLTPPMETATRSFTVTVREENQPVRRISGEYVATALSPFELGLTAPSHPRTNSLAYFFGDSITAGANAASPRSWPEVTAQARQWSLTNLAYGSATISDINWQIMPGFRRTNAVFHGGLPVESPRSIDTNTVSLLLTGYNDMRDGFGAPNQVSYQNFYTASLRHAAAFLAIPTPAKLHAREATTTGTWQPFGEFGGNIGMTATADGSSVTFTGLTGSSLYLGYMSSALNDMGAFTVTIDGVNRGTIPCTGAFGNRTWRNGPNASIPLNAGPNGDGTIVASPLLLRFSGLSEGAHTLVVTASVNPNPVTILWASSSSIARSAIASSAGPSVWVGGTLRSSTAGYGRGNDTAAEVFTEIQSRVSAELAADGLQVYHVSSGTYFDPTIGMSSDSVHPTALGHRQIADSFLESIRRHESETSPVYDGDYPTNSLTFAFVSGPPGLTVSPRGIVSWIPTKAQAGSSNAVVVRVSDNGTPQWSADLVFLIAVRDSNTSPQLSPIADRSVDELNPLSISLNATDANVPQQTLTYSLVTGPEGLSVSAGGDLAWTPTESQGPGSYPVTVQVTDNGVPPLSDTQQFTLGVNEVNAAPELAVVANQTVDELSLLSFNLSAKDADRPAQTLTYTLVSGPEGLSVSTAGVVAWTPTEAQGPGTYTIEVRVADNGFPIQGASRQFTVQVNEVADLVLRTVWQIGADDLPTVLPYRPSFEFSIENGRNDARPGKVTRLPGDPQYVATTNPTADDDFYFAGLYPTGFNGLASSLSIPYDEPFSAWERAQTGSDRTNRMHFTLAPAQVAPGSAYRFSFELVSGGSSIGGVAQAGFGNHDMVVNFRNSAGSTTSLFAQRVTQTTNVVITFTAAAVEALAGANSIEIVRTGPTVSGISIWINADYFRLESLPIPNLPPVLGGLALAHITSTSTGSDVNGAALAQSGPGNLRLGLVSHGGREYLTVTINRAGSLPSGSRYQVEGSTDLSHWTEAPAVTLSTRSSGNLHTTTLQDTLPLGSSDRRFLRVRLISNRLYSE